MKNFSRSILLLICLTVLFASFVVGQKTTKSAICENQLVYPNADFNNFESLIVGNVKQILIQETDLTDGIQSDLIETINYNEQGNITDTFLTNTKIKVFGKHIYSYNNNNQLVKTVSYNPDGSAVTEDIYSYDADRNLKQVVTQNVKSKAIIWKKEFSYDKKKNYSEFFDYLRDYGFRFVKDAKCRMTEVDGYGNSKRVITSKVLINYDDQRNTVEQTVYSPKGEVIGKKKSEFEFDEQGNWIKQSRYELVEVDGKLIYQPVTMVERKIKYYDSK